MKKLLLSIFCLFSIMSYAVADEAVFDFTAPTGLTPSITDSMFDGPDKDGAYAFGTSETTFTNNGVTINTTNGSTVSRIWKAAKGTYDLRLYKTATMTIAAPKGATITAVAFAGGNVNSFSANNGTVDGKNWSGSANEVVFTWASDAKTQKINTITVTFTTDGTTEPDNGGNEGENGDNEGETEESMDITTIDNIVENVESKIQGVVMATTTKSFLVEDETGIVLVYLNKNPEVEVGDVVTVQGTVSAYGGLKQFPQTSVVEKTGNKETVTYPTAEVMDGAALDTYITAPEIMFVEYTGTLTIDGNYYNIDVEGATTAIGSISYPESSIVTAKSGDVIKITGYAVGVGSKKYVTTIAVNIETITEGGEGGEEQEPETPTETKQYTVAEALAAYSEGEQIPAIVTGYIVGTINGQVYEEGCVFSGRATTVTNLLIADKADETDVDNCMPVQLPKTAIRDALNLVDNPQNYKKKVALTGSIEKYFGIAGLKSTSAYEFIEGETGVENIVTENSNAVIFDLTGRKVNSIENAGIYIVNGKKVLVK